MSANVASRGEAVRWNGATWKVDDLDEDGVHLRNVVTGQREGLSVGEWLGGVETALIERRVRPSALGRGTPRKGAFMRWKDATWRVTVVRGGLINLQDIETDENGAISVREWNAACFEGRAEMVEAPGAELDERVRAVLSMPIASMPESMRSKVDRAALFFEAWREPDRFFREHMPHLPEAERVIPRCLSRTAVERFLDLVASVHGIPRPGFSTFCKWLDKARQAGGDIRAMVPRHDLQGPHRRYMNPRVEQWLCEAIDGVWLTNRKNKKNRVHDELAATVAEWNAAYPDRCVQCPSVGHVARYIREEVDRMVVARRRGSKEEADRAFRQTGRGIRTSFVMERVEVDHTLVQLNVRHDTTGVLLGYPWVTAALDHHSRMPLAAHLNFGSQSLGANLQCLKQVMTPKTFLPELVPELDYEFPAGVPHAFYFDRGSDYDNASMRRVGQSLDIVIEYEPAGCPEYKGAIERWWRTLKEDVVYGLPGAKLPGSRDVAGVDANGEAYIAYSEFVRRMWLWMSMVYAKSHHRGIGDVPLRRWQESADRTLPRALRRKDDLAVLLTRVERCPVSTRGVTYNGLTWVGEPLKAIMRNPAFRDGMKVEVRIDEHDVSKAWVINPYSLRDEPLESVLPNYTRGLSMHAHDRIVTSMPKAVAGTLGERSLLKGKQALREQANALMTGAARRKGGKFSSAAAKFAGIGQSAPAGDDLGDVLAAGFDDEIPDLPPIDELDEPAPPEPPRPPRRRAERFRNDD